MFRPDPVRLAPAQAPPSPQGTMRNTRCTLPLSACLAFALPALHSAESTADPSKKDEPVVLSIFQVTGEKDEGYRSTQTTSGSRTLSNLRDTPTSISVLNRELLDDLMATKLGDALFFSITGEISDNTERTSEDFVFRGVSTNIKLRNGITWLGATSDSYNIELDEILRAQQASLSR